MNNHCSHILEANICKPNIGCYKCISDTDCLPGYKCNKFNFIRLSIGDIYQD